jgi:hypothetical protein
MANKPIKPISYEGYTRKGWAREFRLDYGYIHIPIISNVDDKRLSRNTKVRITIEEIAGDLLTCPFCGDDKFDELGLKIHLLKGHCEKFEKVEGY